MLNKSDYTDIVDDETKFEYSGPTSACDNSPPLSNHESYDQRHRAAKKFGSARVTT